VTGHTGFKGAWLCEWLLSLGAEIHGFSLPGTGTTPSLFDQLGLSERMNDGRGDIRDRAALCGALLAAQPDFVFHLAAQPLVRPSYREPLATWESNVLGTIHVLEALREYGARFVERGAVGTSDRVRATHGPVVAVLITTDKVYENRECLHGYREVDPLGGHDPYSSSKAAAEIAIQSWRKSFFEDDALRDSCRVASARAGNVIGGGDWALDRIVPDAIRALAEGKPIPVRNKTATRPWQHVLEPLSGYLLLAAALARASGKALGARNTEHVVNEGGDRALHTQCDVRDLCSAFNFGPPIESNKTVKELVEEVLRHWPGTWQDRSDPQAPYEAGKLNLVWDKAHRLLGWSPRWNFAATLEKTVQWYRAVHEGADPAALTRDHIRRFVS
jgi:CDP-glucose 4,6-dehydratase